MFWKGGGKQKCCSIDLIICARRNELTNLTISPAAAGFNTEARKSRSLTSLSRNLALKASGLHHLHFLEDFSNATKPL
jgi:hypothetical protein